MEILLTGIGLIVVMLTWKFVWLPTVLDTTRDRLFDLRDDLLRSYFIENGFSLDHPIYKRLRTLLNGHLRHTESLSLSEFVFFIVTIGKNKRMATNKLQEIERKFKSNDPKIQVLIDKIRIESSAAMIGYMLRTSVCGMLLSLLSIPVLWLWKIPLKSMFSTKPAEKARNVMETVALAA